VVIKASIISECRILGFYQAKKVGRLQIYPFLIISLNLTL